MFKIVRPAFAIFLYGTLQRSVNCFRNSHSLSYSFTVLRNNFCQNIHQNGRGIRAMSSSPIALVKTISAQDFGKIVNSPSIVNYQIIDVREPNELEVVSIKKSEIVNLPLGKFAEWNEKVLSGELLDPTKPTLCMCHHGMRSMRMATFLTQQAGFIDVYNVIGGINKYAEDVDPSIGKY